MKKIHGFTLIELMITIAIAAILLTVAVPAFQQTVRSNRTTTQANDLLSSFNLARMEGIRRSANITVCPSSNGTTCAGSGVNDWRIGWISFLDIDGNGVIDDTQAGDCNINNDNTATPQEDCLLRTRKALPSGTTLTATSGAGAFKYKITFTSTGIINDPATGINATTAALDPIALTLRSSNCGVGGERRIVVNNLGRSQTLVRNCP